MEHIDGHIIDKKLLTHGGLILDAGCRGFGLEKALGPDYFYLCFEPDESVKVPDELKGYHILFWNNAIMPYSGKTKYCGWSTGEGNICYEGTAPHYAELDTEVYCVSLNDITKEYGRFDLIKLDIEGCEYDVLLGITEPVAKQICVEFHQSLGYNKYGTHQEYIDKLMASKFGEIYAIAEFYEYPELPGMFEYLFKLK